jgi:YbbR domain-containing protein
MRRVLAVVVHNWPLKLAAVVLATLLYAGIVLSENVQTFPASIPIVPIRQPENAVIVGNLPSITNIRYVAPTDVAGRLTRDGFTASIDLGSASPTAGNPFVTVPVDLRYADGRVRILDFSPQVITVRLDPLIQKTVPVDIDQGPTPSGLEAGEPVLSATKVTVSGPDSIVRLVAAARGRVLIQPSAIDVDQNVPLVAVDALGNEQGPADLEPSEVHVSIKVGGLTTTKTVAITPTISGSPADGFEVSQIDVTPLSATLAGDADALTPITRIATTPVSISGTSRDVASTVSLALPEGVTAVSPKQVDVTVHVRAVRGSRTYSIGVRLAGARPDRTYALGTQQVSLALGGTVAALDAVNASGLVATANVGSLGPGRHTVRLSVPVPAGTTVTSVSPASVIVTVGVPTPAATARPAPTPTPTPAPSPSGP